MFTTIEKDVHDTALDEYELNMIKNNTQWKLEDSEQWKLIEQGEKELAVSEWSVVVQEQATLKNYRDK